MIHVSNDTDFSEHANNDIPGTKIHDENWTWTWWNLNFKRKNTTVTLQIAQTCDQLRFELFIWKIEMVNCRIFPVAIFFIYGGKCNLSQIF